MSAEASEIKLGGYRFRLADQIRRIDQERYPGRVITGSPAYSDESKASAWVIQDLSGGQGVYYMDPDTQQDRYWFGVGIFHTYYFGHPPYAHDAGGADYTVLAEFENAIYGANTKVYKRDDANNTWIEKHSLLGQAVCWIEFGGRLYIGCGSAGYSYSDDGETWSDVVAAAISFTIWDGKLIKIDSTGAMSHSANGTSWTSLLTLPYPSGSYQKLFIYFNYNNEACIYVAHTRGFDWIDFTSAKSYPTGLILPKHPYGGKAAGVWRGDYAFYGAGLSAYGWTPGNARNIGLDRDDGVPSDMRGLLVDIASAHYALYAALDNTTASTPALAGRSTRWHWNAPKIMNEAIGFSYIMEWTGSAWRAIWQSGDQAKSMRCLLLSDVYDYRLWWVADGHVWYMKRPLGVVDPKLVSTSEYDDQATLLTPWFQGKNAVDSKAALEVALTTEGLSATETLTVWYGLNGSESWTQIGIYSSNTIPSFLFSSGAGVEFERVRFKFQLDRLSGVITAAGWVIALKFRYRVALPKLKAWSARIDCTQEYAGLAPRKQIELLNSFSTSDVLTAFVYEYPEVTYYVETSIQGRESAGRNKGGIFDVMLNECR